MVPEQFDTHMKKKKKKPSRHRRYKLSQKLTQKWIADLNVKHKIRKFLKI